MNNPIANVQIIEDPEYGVILVCQDLELADQFEDLNRTGFVGESIF